MDRGLGGLVHEKVQDKAACEKIEKEQREGEGPDHPDTCTKTFFNPRQLAGTDILGRVVGNPVAQRGEGGDNQVIQFDGSRVAGHDTRSKTVDHTLDDDVADGDEALLQDTWDRDQDKFVQKGKGK